MHSYQISVIIPVFNQWELTRQCLLALAESLAGENAQVIVVDNASTDLTAGCCSELGATLFGGAFVRIRNERNRNFGPACNQGARAATGEFLVFLNNDTVAERGWLRPLLDDFRDIPGLAATGPLLVYPPRAPFGHSVQHLGVVITPFATLDHFHEWIPADSPLANKRRFFQAITGACMAIPRALFMDSGMFYPGYANGFEDVDLCARLSARGLRLSVNPGARVVHYASQSQGRLDMEKKNSELLYRRTRKILRPDWQSHLESDGLRLAASPWLQLVPVMPDEAGPDCGSGGNDLVGMLTAMPYWREGWRKLIEQWPDYSGRQALRCQFFNLMPDPWIAIDAIRDALKSREPESAEKWLAIATGYCLSEPDYSDQARRCAELMERSGHDGLARQYRALQAEAGNFYASDIVPLRRRCAALDELLGGQAPGDRRP